MISSSGALELLKDALAEYEASFSWTHPSMSWRASGSALDPA
jgi:hypothetical protein